MQHIDGTGNTLRVTPKIGNCEESEKRRGPRHTENYVQHCRLQRRQVKGFGAYLFIVSNCA